MSQRTRTSVSSRTIANVASHEVSPDGRGCEFASETQLWAVKRQQQRHDLESLQAGRATEDQMSWFSAGRARACRLVNLPY